MDRSAFAPVFDGVEINFIADVRPFFTKENAAKIDEAVAQPLKQGSCPRLVCYQGSLCSHDDDTSFLRLGPGTYETAHRHGPGFNIVIIDD
jgi:hypothetical protein